MKIFLADLVYLHALTHSTIKCETLRRFMSYFLVSCQPTVFTVIKRFLQNESPHESAEEKSAQTVLTSGCLPFLKIILRRECNQRVAALELSGAGG